MTLIEIKKSIKNTLFTFNILVKSLSLFRIFLEFMICAGRALLPLATAYITKIIIDEAALANKNPNIGTKIFTRLMLLVVISIVIIGIEAGLEIIQKKMREIDIYKISKDIQLRIVEKAKKMDQKHFDDNETYNIISRGGGFSEERIYSLYLSAEIVFTNLVSSFGYTIVLFKFSWIIALLALMVEIPKYYIAQRSISDNNELTKKVTELNRKKDYYASILKSSQFSKEVRIFGSKNLFLNTYSKIRENIFGMRRKIYLKNNMHTICVSFANTIISCAVYGYILYKALIHNITIGDISLLFLAYTTISEVVQSVFEYVNEFYNNAISTDYFLQYLKIPNEIICEDNNEKNKVDINEGISIEFVNVSFKYPGSDRYILKNISFKLNYPSTVAIIGLNGAGKTTLVKLLLRIYDPVGGYILVNNKKLTDYNSIDYYKKWSILFQDYRQYAFTLEEAITMNDEINCNKINHAIDVSQVKAFMYKMSGGLKTQLTKTFFSDGYVPSGGEAQRIALARAIYFSDTLMILDEPSASIDALAENEIFKQIDKNFKDKLIVMISHRLSNVVNADKIIVLSNNTIAEMGTHSDLMHKNGIYKKLFIDQAKRYNKELRNDDE